MSWLPPGDAAALIASVALWVGFTVIIEHSRWTPQTLTAIVNGRRLVWMREAMDRDFRITDVSLLTTLMNSVSFFASASLILLGAAAAALGTVSHGFEEVQAAIPFIKMASRALVEFKLLLIGVIFIYSFLNFTWSIQQFNYCCILLGSAPPHFAPDSDKHSYAKKAARLNALGARSFNRGLRGYYFALAALGWFFDPLLLVGGTVAVVLILARREFYSHTRQVMRDL